MPILEIKKLTKYYGKTLAVNNLSLSLEEGEVFGIIGPNGAGKSTTIRAIMNLVNKTKGEVLINNEVFTKDKIHLKEIIGYLPSEINLYDDLTVKEILNYHETFYNKNINSRRKELVKKLKLDESKKIEDLSFGNLKKVGIILALMHQPKILILDEPTSGLDPIMQQIFFEIIEEEKKKGTTIFYSTHILTEISKICDRVAIIKEGKLLATETINELHKKNLTYVTIESKEIDKIEEELKIKDAVKNKNEIKFQNTNTPNELIKKLSNYKIDKLLIEESTIEDLFLHYYK